jgi:hypothetical protein
MVNSIIEQSGSKNILIIGAPRSGTHALASLIKRQKPSLSYLVEIGMSQQSETPWQDIDIFLENSANTYLAHIVQLKSKIGMLPVVDNLKKTTFVVNIRRKDKVKQFASWIYFKSIGAIYNFNHYTEDFVPPSSYTVSYEMIEQFIIEQLIDDQFRADLVIYYEDVDFSKSLVKKNSYAFSPELMIKNLDEVKLHLSTWTYPIK